MPPRRRVPEPAPVVRDASNNDHDGTRRAGRAAAAAAPSGKDPPQRQPPRQQRQPAPGRVKGLVKGRVALGPLKPDGRGGLVRGGVGPVDGGLGCRHDGGGTGQELIESDGGSNDGGGDRGRAPKAAPAVGPAVTAFSSCSGGEQGSEAGSSGDSGGGGVAAGEQEGEVPRLRAQVAGLQRRNAVLLEDRRTMRLLVKGRLACPTPERLQGQQAPREDRLLLQLLLTMLDAPLPMGFGTSVP